MANKIVIIEDEHILAGMYAERFRNEGWDVHTASTKDGGLEITKKEKPDIILLDILLFDGHGVEFLKQKNKDKTIAKIPVLVFSNLDDAQTKKEALDLGILEYLLKTNHTPQELVEKAKYYVGKQ
jgi:DNA-binding response OmpR family regulator